MASAGSAQDGAAAGPAWPDPESAEWLAGLTVAAPQRDAAVERLHDLLVRIARSEIRRRNVTAQITGPELDDLAYQAAADALLAITAKLGEFRGESRFTTWACKFVMFEVSAKLGRHFWRKPAAALTAADWNRLPDRFGFSPVEQSERRELLEALRRAVKEELTERQRTVFVAIVVTGVPVDVLAQQLGTNRNAIYKTVFDARRKLRASLAANGHLRPEISRPA